MSVWMFAVKHFCTEVLFLHLIGFLINSINQVLQHIVEFWCMQEITNHPFKILTRKSRRSRLWPQLNCVGRMAGVCSEVDLNIRIKFCFCVLNSNLYIPIYPCFSTRSIKLDWISLELNSLWKADQFFKEDQLFNVYANSTGSHAFMLCIGVEYTAQNK